MKRYTDNGGSTLGIAGKDFVIVAGDTRSTSGYNINSRYTPKVYRVGGEGDSGEGAHIILSLVGYAADGIALRDRLNTIVKLYKYQHGKDMTVAACAQRLATILYSKRFFPYYVQAILGAWMNLGQAPCTATIPSGLTKGSNVELLDRPRA